MIRNIVFDMGGVLIEFNPSAIIARYHLNEEQKCAIMREVFREEEWIALDEGTITEQEAVQSIQRRLPEELHAAAEDIILNWWKEPFTNIEGMGSLIYELKQAGYHIYLLSNATLRQAEYFSRIPANEVFEGRVTSAEVKMCKPHYEIFDYLLDAYHLKAEESCFVDDSSLNVHAANHLGFHALVFHDAQRLRKDLRQAGVRIELA